jgi:hypothetical protein
LSAPAIGGFAVHQHIRSKLTYANVISTLCLFLLLGGGAAYAASHLAKNSVGPRQLRKGAVTPRKVAAATIRLFGGQKGDPGAQGPRGSQGAQGPQGAPGPTAGAVGGFNTPGASFDFAAAPPQTVVTSSAGKLLAMAGEGHY